MDHSTNHEMFMTGTLRVVKDGKPLSGADISIFDQVRTTDSEGVAQFEHVMTGTSTARIIYQGKEFDQDVTFSQPNTSINLNGAGTTYEKTTAVAPSFGRDAMMDQMKTVAANKNGGYLLIGGAIFVLFLIFLVVRFLLPRLVKLAFSNPKARKITLIGGSLLAVVGIISWIFYQSQLTTNTTRAMNFTSETRASTNNSLPVPGNVKAYPDDRVAIVTWDLDADSPTRNLQVQEDHSKGIYGYYIEWTKESLGFSTATKMITEFHWAQLQPLEPGVPYIARIFAVDVDGNVSTESQTVRFTDTSARVDGLRTQMNGFFDDFNRAQGAFDELKWNMSYSGCVGEGLGGQFINSQYHGHNEASATNCDRGMSIARPRKTIDFRNRTATITFDLDGSAGSRTKWYLDVLGIISDVKADAPIDITSRIADNTGDIAHPGNILRIRQYNGAVEVLTVDAKGEAALINTLQTKGTKSCDNWGGGTPLEYCKSSLNNVPLDTTPNFRRHWKVLLSKSKIDIYIDDMHAFQGNINLPFETAYLHWLWFTYNTPKENRPMELVHWDNFGFDAPANDPQQNVETHNYTDGLVGTKQVDDQNLPHSVAYENPPQLLTVKIPIPDEIKDKNGANPIAARLMFTLQGYNNHSFEWQASDNVTLNGTTNKYLIPKPSSSTGLATLVSDYQPYSMTIPIDPNKLVKGDNTLVFTIQRSGIFNVHIELDYPKTAAPSYTQPNQIFANYNQKVIPVIPDIGPGAYIDSINNTVTWDKVSHTENFIGTFNGTIDVNVNAYSHPSEVGNGKNYGIRGMELLVDRAVAVTKNTGSQVPIGEFDGTLKYDTAQLCNGVHEIAYRAFNGNGTTSIPDFFQMETVQGEYFPLTIKTNNPGKPACSGTYIPASTPIPYVTAPPAAPTSEHQLYPTSRSLSLIMYQQNNSGQQGTVTLTDLGSNTTRVLISIPALTFTNQPAHIHTGTCAAPGPVVYSLTNVSGGQSDTTVNQNFDLLLGHGYIVNVHKSTSESTVYTSCTQLVDPLSFSPTPTLVPITAVPTTTVPTTIAPSTIVPTTVSVTPSLTPGAGTPVVTPIPSVTSAVVSPTGSSTVAPTSQISSAISPSTCPLKPKGDANCDNKINLVDLEIWTREFLGQPGRDADFNEADGVTLVDLQIWQTSYLGL